MSVTVCITDLQSLGFQLLALPLLAQASSAFHSTWRSCPGATNLHPTVRCVWSRGQSMTVTPGTCPFWSRSFRSLLGSESTSGLPWPLWSTGDCIAIHDPGFGQRQRFATGVCTGPCCIPLQPPWDHATGPLPARMAGLLHVKRPELKIQRSKKKENQKYLSTSGVVFWHWKMQLELHNPLWAPSGTSPWFQRQLVDQRGPRGVLKCFGWIQKYTKTGNTVRANVNHLDAGQVETEYILG